MPPEMLGILPRTRAGYTNTADIRSSERVVHEILTSRTTFPTTSSPTSGYGTRHWSFETRDKKLEGGNKHKYRVRGENGHERTALVRARPDCISGGDSAAISS